MTDFDVLVVGSGSGGGVVASRLSEDPRLRVLLLEAGPDLGTSPPDEVLHPRLGSGIEAYDWDYLDPSIGLGLPRGRLVGGSSAVNATIAMRGQPQDYDRWAELGATGWTWESCLPYFRRLEADADFGDSPYHGSDGPIHVQRQLPLLEAEQVFAAACQELGARYVPDHNQPGAVGVGPVPRNLRNGVRQSVLVTYLAMARGRDNLTIRADALVDRVRFDGDRATGVVLADGTELTGGTVVLAAGAYNTPTVLMRSGVGPGDTLAAAGIECRHELGGVGRNLLDHPVTLLTLLMSYAPDPAVLRFPVALKLRADGGPGLDDLKLSLYPGDVFNMPGLTGLFLEVNESHTRGQVTVASADPTRAPDIQHRFLSDHHDVRLMMAGLRHAATLAEVMSGASGCEMLLPDRATVEDDDQLRTHCLQFHGTGYHPAGTCRLGAADDADAVVDPQLRVRGLQGLVVADASVMPELPRCNINLPTMMIGERAADLVREGL
ncbi:MAG: GMC family oxidoreductase N-terminal domain-containing protein [Candidatus Dormibacteraeota bacterium]|nr:GMC family oxidoreductase N-terminal domain-containing protein [Candidatus Dormibacteraeota bacterium]